MPIPLLLKGVTVLVDLLKKQLIEKPKMGRLLGVEVEFILEASEERTPLSCEPFANFHPASFNAGIVSGSLERRVSKAGGQTDHLQ